MGSTWFWLSYLTLWSLVLVLSIAVNALLRFQGKRLLGTLIFGRNRDRSAERTQQSGNDLEFAPLAARSGCSDVCTISREYMDLLEAGVHCSSSTTHQGIHSADVAVALFQAALVMLLAALYPAKPPS